jgi:hypothetical protein
MAKKKKDKGKLSSTPPKKDITVRTNLSFEQLLNLAANTPIKPKPKKK